MKKHKTIPESLPTQTAFTAVLSLVIERFYSDLEGCAFAGVRYEDNEDGKASFDCDLSNAIEDAASRLAMPTDAESCGTYFDWAAEFGWRWDGVDPSNDDTDTDED